MTGGQRRCRGVVEVFNNRMQVYLTPLKDIETFYSKQKVLHKINGERMIEEIVSEMESFIKGKM